MTLAAQFIDYTKPLTSRDTWEDTVSGWGIDTGNDEPEVVLAEIMDHTRWAVIHRQVFRFADGSHAEVQWSTPATEQQDQDPECEWVEVVPWQVMTTMFAPVPPPRHVHPPGTRGAHIMTWDITKLAHHHSSYPTYVDMVDGLYDALTALEAHNPQSLTVKVDRSPSSWLLAVEAPVNPHGLMPGSTPPGAEQATMADRLRRIADSTASRQAVEDLSPPRLVDLLAQVGVRVTQDVLSTWGITARREAVAWATALTAAGTSTPEPGAPFPACPQVIEDHLRSQASEIVGQTPIPPTTWNE